MVFVDFQCGGCGVIVEGSSATLLVCVGCVPSVVMRRLWPVIAIGRVVGGGGSPFRSSVLGSGR